jgi:hypothetical protein
VLPKTRRDDCKHRQSDWVLQKAIESCRFWKITGYNLAQLAQFDSWIDGWKMLHDEHLEFCAIFRINWVIDCVPNSLSCSLFFSLIYHVAFAF